MKYPLMPGRTVEYMVLHALEAGMGDVWSIRKHLLLQGADYMVWPPQISSALQRLKRAGVVQHRNELTRDRWELAAGDEGGDSGALFS